MIFPLVLIRALTKSRVEFREFVQCQNGVVKGAPMLAGCIDLLTRATIVKGSCA